MLEVGLADPSRTPPPLLDITFPPDQAALESIVWGWDRGLCPFRIGHNVSLELFNRRLADSEDGLRVDYDEGNRQVVV